MRKLIAEIFDPATRYEYELPLPSDFARALELDAWLLSSRSTLVSFPSPPFHLFNQPRSTSKRRGLQRCQSNIYIYQADRCAAQ